MSRSVSPLWIGYSFHSVRPFVCLSLRSIQICYAHALVRVHVQILSNQWKNDGMRNILVVRVTCVLHNVTWMRYCRPWVSESGHNNGILRVRSPHHRPNVFVLDNFFVLICSYLIRQAFIRQSCTWILHLPEPALGRRDDTMLCLCYCRIVVNPLKWCSIGWITTSTGEYPSPMVTVLVIWIYRLHSVAGITVFLQCMCVSG